MPAIRLSLEGASASVGALSHAIVCLSQPSVGYRAAGQARQSLPVPQQRAGPPPASAFPISRRI